MDRSADSGVEQSRTRIERLVVGPLATNCYILESQGEVAVIDPGGDADVILDKVQEMCGEKRAVKYVINTHGHVDHVAANSTVIEATGAQLLIGALDAGMIAHPERSLAAMMGLRLKPLKPDRTLSEGDEVVVGRERLRVAHTPGHTPGGITLIGDGLAARSYAASPLAEDGRRFAFAFTGDTLFVDSIGRVDFPGGSETQMRNSLGRLQALLSRDTMVYPGHGEPGTMGRALLINPFLGSIWPA